MTVAAARALGNDDICFVGIGLPSAACNLARLTHAPRLTLVYESGTLETKPHVLPLSIGDGELCETALTTVSVPEMFQVLAAGRPDLGRLSRRRAGRSLRKPEQHRDRRLPDAESAPAGQRRRDRDRDQLRPHLHRHAPDGPHVRQPAGFHDLARARPDRPRAARDGRDDGGTGAGRDRLVYDETASGHDGIHRCQPAPGRDARIRFARDRLGSSLRRNGRDDGGAAVGTSSRRSEI